MFVDAFYSNITSYDSDIRLEQYTAYSCPNSLSASGLQVGQKQRDPKTYNACLRAHEIELSALKDLRPDVVIFSDLARGSETRAYQVGLSQFLTIAQKYADDVVVLGQTPVWPKVDTCLNRLFSNQYQCAGSSFSIAKTVQAQKIATSKVGGKFIEMTKYLCQDNVCPLAIDGIPVTADGGPPAHITWQVAHEMGPMLIADIVRDVRTLS
jgi:hypothetical protein